MTQAKPSASERDLGVEFHIRRRRRERPALWTVLLKAAKFVAAAAIVSAVVLTVTAIGLAAGTLFALSRSLPKLGDLRNPAAAQTTKIYDSQGQLPPSFDGAENRLIVFSSEIPPVMKQATVAVEDKRFYSDFTASTSGGLPGRLLADLGAGHAVQGASTITEQYVKNAYLGGYDGRPHPEASRGDPGLGARGPLVARTAS